MSQQFLFMLIGLSETISIWLFHRFCPYADGKGWRYYRRRERAGDSSGFIRGMLELERFLTPSAVHRTETKETTVKAVRPNVPDDDDHPSSFASNSAISDDCKPTEPGDDHV